MNFLKKLAVISLLMLTCLVHATPTKKASMAMPLMAIKTIKNETDFDIVIIDRLVKKEVSILAGASQEVNMPINNKRNVVINGSMVNILAGKSQYVIRKIVDGIAETESEVYLQLHTTEGGIDNGSGFITGMPGTIIFNFLMVGKQGGCIMSTRKLQNTDCKEAKLNLRLFMNDGRLSGNGDLIEQ